MSSPDRDSNFNDEQEDGNFEDERPVRDNPNNAQHLGATLILASKFAANTRRGAKANQKVLVGDPASTSLKMPQLFKPDEPDFSVDREDI